MYNNYQTNAYRPSHDDVKSACHMLMNYHVTFHTNDGAEGEGIIVDMDDDGVTMLVPEDVEDDQDSRQFGGFGGYGGYGRRRFRRFRRRRFPFFFFVFPFFRPYPYYY